MSNVAVVVLDTLRKDRFRKYFSDLPGRRFECAYAPSHWTVPVIGSLFTGLYPSEHGAKAHSPVLDTERTTISERLSEAGHTTRLWTSNVFISPAFGFDRGFDTFTGTPSVKQTQSGIVDWSDFYRDHEADPLRYLKAIWTAIGDDVHTIKSIKTGIETILFANDISLFRDHGISLATRWVRKTEFGTDSFLFMNLMEAHAPYDYIPETFQTDVNYRPPRKLSPDMDFGTQSDRNRLCTAYDDAAQYLAKQYTTLFDLLTAQFDYVITLADHGEMLGENECWGHESGLYPELVHVPLVVWGDDTADGTVKTPVSTLSVYQTILDIAELDLNVDRHGQSLLGEITSEAHLTEEHGLKQQRIAADTYNRALFEHLTTEELADVNMSIDRGVIREDGEYIHPQEGKSPAVTGKAATIRDAIVADLDIAKYVKKKDSEVDEGVKDRLSRLGYR